MLSLSSREREEKRREKERREEKRKSRAEAIFEKIITDNFP